MFLISIHPVSVSLVRFQVIIIISIPLGFSDELPVSIYLIGLDAFQRLPVDFYVVDLSFSVEFERDGSDGPIVRSGEVVSAVGWPVVSCPGREWAGIA